MNPEDIIKAAPEIAKGAEALAAAIPFTAIVKRMLGPAADEVAEMWRDQVRIYRYGRQLKCIEKAEKMARDAGFTPTAVPPKILFPLLEGASLEEDENLHDMWAALLANAASPHNAASVRPGFIAILRQMSPDEAQVLNWLYDQTCGQKAIDYSALANAQAELGFRDSELVNGRPSFDNRLQICLDGLRSQRLLSDNYQVDPDRGDPINFRPVVITSFLTRRGVAFVVACRPPKPT